MRIRHLFLAVSLLVPFGLVAVATEPAPPSAAYVATTAVEVPEVEAAMVATIRLQREAAAQAAFAEQQAAEKAAEKAKAAEREELAARAVALRRAQEAANRPKVTATTVARRYTATTVASAPVSESKTYPTGSMPPKYVSDCESGGNPRAVNPNGHYGKWQFSQSTWESVGGTGRPHHASEAEQDYRASLLWDNGNGAGHWECY
jgi:hypothetical protein